MIFWPCQTYGFYMSSSYYCGLLAASLSSRTRLSSAGFARPLEAFMAWPTKNPLNLTLPAQGVDDN